jgi:hypothetical protein
MALRAADRDEGAAPFDGMLKRSRKTSELVSQAFTAEIFEKPAVVVHKNSTGAVTAWRARAAE